MASKAAAAAKPAWPDVLDRLKKAPPFLLPIKDSPVPACHFAFERYAALFQWEANEEGTITAICKETPTKDNQTARYSFWPANKERLPLLFICASIILSAPATSTSNEGFHSIVTLLLRPNRRSMSKKRVQGYSLMRASLRATLKTKFGKAIDDIESEALKSGYLDVAEVREVLGLSDDVRFDDDTISDSDSNSGSDNDDLIDCMSN